MKEGYNGDMPTKNTGQIGGAIGGKMVHEMIKQAEQEVAKKYKS